MALDNEVMVGLFNDHQTALMRYATRRVGIGAAPDIVADTFTVAFRHNAPPPDALPWLYAIARNVIRNQVRGSTRAAARALPHMANVQPDLADDVVERDAVITALRSLTDSAREVLMLVAWEGLSPEQGALAMGCSNAAFRVRLHRARQQLNAAMALPPSIVWTEGATS
jgi:RNA polymerase sigma-70 factor, ECF subfamily